MQTYGSSVVPMIEANYEMFTVVEKTIADFFISNEKEMDFSSGRMAKMLHVSEASLSRFAKKMGYSGYREFIYNYQPSIAERPNVEEQTIHVLYSYEELLQKTYSLIREPQIKHVSQLIGEHTRIFFVWIWQFWAGGTGVSTSVAAAWHGCGGNHGTAPDGIE